MTSPQQPFHLYRLPSLALEEIFKILEVQEKLHLSLCSTGSKMIVTFFCKSKHSYQVCFHFRTDSFQFSITAQGSKFSASNAQQVCIWKSLRLLRSFKKTTKPWTKFENDVIYLLDFVTEVFHKPILQLDVSNRRHTFVDGFLQKINNLGLEISRLSVSSSQSEDEIVQSTLDYCTSAREVIIDCQTTSRFYYQPKKLNKSGDPLALDRLRITNAKWVTTRHVVNLFMNYKRLALFHCNSKKLELGAFIKKWIDSKSPIEVAVLQRYGEYMTLAGVMRGIKSTVLPRVAVDGIYCIYPSYLIEQRATGKKAVVYCDGCLALSMNFKL